MLSKNNRKEQFRKQEPKKQRFAIKKLTVGVASVLIGFTFMGMNASADTHSNTANQEAIQTNINLGSKTLNNEQTNSSNSVANRSANNTVSNDANNQNLVTSQGIDQSKIVQNTTTEPAQNSQVQSVRNYSQFLNALQNKNISTITLDKNIDFSNANLNNGSYQDINNYGIARTVTIDGQNQYALNMGNNYIDLDSNTYYEPNASNPTRNWNVVLKDLNLQTTSGYGPFWFNSATSNDSTLTFNGVTTSKDSGQLLNNSTASSYPNVNVNFEGQNKLQGSLNNSNITSSALIQANNVNFINGSTVFVVNNNSSSDLANVQASGNVVIENGAKVDFNSEATSNMAGISFAEGGAGNQTIDNATSGVLRLMPNAQVTMELGSGASMGVNNASNLDLQDNSSLKITTSKMNTTGFRSAGLVGLDYDGDTNDSTVRISPNALLSVIRTNVTNSDAPLLAMGPNSGTGQIYHLEVNGGSLNLQDSAYSSFLPSSYTLSKGQYSDGWPAILTMWGTSSQNYLNFNNAKLINLQRTAPNKPGYLIKTEGAGDYAYHQTHIVINSPDNDYNTPLTIIPAGETKPVTWNVKYLNNTSQGGDYAYAFRSYRDFGDWNNEGSEYMNGSVNDDTPAKGVNEVVLTPDVSDPGSNSFSNGAVVPEGNETEASKALNSFINHFSWWNTSGVKFGSSLEENTQYTPEGQDVNTKTGVVPNPAEGIKNKSDLPDGTKYTWKDTPDVTIAGDKPATVVVTYPDGSKDEVPVTIHVTNPATDADKYTPEGQDVNTKTGVVPNPAEGIKNKSDLPDGTKYTWKDTPDVTTAGDKPATVVVSYPDGSKDEVPVTIHVTNPATDADKYTPEGQDVNTKTGELPNPADGIKNKSDLPDSTKYTWKDTPDVTTAGDKPATIVVTYPDGSKDEVPVTIHVTNPATDADKYTPETQPITTPEGKVPDPADGIKNKADLPDGTKYIWTNPDQVAQDVKTPGSHTETITVTYPDGSKDTVTVTVNVPAPEGQNITTDQGKLPNPADAIKNKDQMPDGTTYTWKQKPDVSTLGDHIGVVEVHFPDGTTYEVTVDVHVDAVNPDNGGNMNSGNGSIDHQNGTEINNGNMTNANNGSVIENITGQTQNSATNSTSQQPAKTLPQTGNDSSKFSALAGLSLAAFASLFGFAGHDKKRKADK